MKKYLLILALTLVPSLLVAQTTLLWNTGDGTWNDATTTNWNPNGIPAPGDNVTINPTGGATVDYASSAFDQDTDFLSRITIGGNGDASVLQIGAGDILRFNNTIMLNNGGRLEITGGLVQDHYTTWRSTVEIGNGASMLVTGGVFQNHANGHFRLATLAGQTASLEVSGTGQILGDPLITGAAQDFEAAAGNSTLLLADDGRIEFARNVKVGNTGGTHNWTITGGTLTKLVGQSNFTDFGNNNANGSVTVNQSGGTVNFRNIVTPSQGDIVRINQTAHYTISGDAAEVFFLTSQFELNGQFTQNGGDVYLNYENTIGNVAGQHGVYTATAGNMRSRGVSIGTVADASGTLTLHQGVNYTVNPNSVQAFIIGATTGSGTGTLEIVGFNGLNAGGFRYVRIHETGVVRGHGTLAGTVGEFIVNGRIIADGYGADQTLDLSGRTGMTNTVDNTSDKGLYAINGGELLLANVAVTAGNTTVNWGEDPSDTTIDLVNSVRLAFTNAIAGNLTGSLLAVDRTDLPPPTFSGGLISVHEFTSTFSFDSVDMIFRYDNSLVSDPDDLRLHHYTGGNWVEITNFTVDENLYLLTAPGVDSFSLFAVSVIPEPSTYSLLAGLATLGFVLLRRRRARASVS